MKFLINNNNYKLYIKDEKYLVIDQQFLNNPLLHEIETLTIENIDDRNIELLFTSFTQVELSIDVYQCSFRELTFSNIELKRILIHTVFISEPKEGKFKSYCSRTKRCRIKDLEFMFSTIYNGFLLGECNIARIYIKESSFDYNFVVTNSEIDELNFSECRLESIDINKDSLSNKLTRVKINKILILHTDILNQLSIRDIEFNNVSLYQTRLSKSEKLNDFWNYISISADENSPGIEEILISESIVPTKLVITAKKAQKLRIYDSNINGFRLNTSKILNFEISSTVFTDNFWIGYQNHLKEIESLNIYNCNFESYFELKDIIFAKECKILGSSFKKYPAFFQDNMIPEQCSVSFKDSNLENYIFQGIDFKFFRFEDLDITNCQFRDCFWQEKIEFFSTRNIVADELEVFEVDKLIKVKDIYAKLKSNSEKNSDFINSSKFHISEQEVKKRIFRDNHDIVSYIFISTHKLISSYGENFKKPLFLIFSFFVLFSIIYLFTGFFDNNRMILYDFSFNSDNTYNTLRDWWLSLLFSLKNLIPLPTNANFFLRSDSSLSLTQTLELLQKLINLFLAASFSAALIKSLKK